MKFTVIAKCLKQAGVFLGSILISQFAMSNIAYATLEDSAQQKGINFVDMLMIFIIVGATISGIVGFFLQKYYSGEADKISERTFMTIFVLSILDLVIFALSHINGLFQLPF